MNLLRRIYTINKNNNTNKGFADEETVLVGHSKRLISFYLGVVYIRNKTPVFLFDEHQLLDSGCHHQRSSASAQIPEVKWSDSHDTEVLFIIIVMRMGS